MKKDEHNEDYRRGFADGLRLAADEMEAQEMPSYIVRTIRRMAAGEWMPERDDFIP
jgi:hypothetical protein